MEIMASTPATTYGRGNLYQIPITDFKPDPDQPRKVIDPDDLAELAASIAKFGILQPLLFREAEQGWVYIVAGERRYQAAQQAGLLVIPAICVTGDYAEIALVENLQRQDLTAVEEAEALQRLKDEQKYTDEQLAGVIGKARQTVSDILTLNRLPLDIRDKCRGDRQISRRTLIDISRKTQERAMITAYNAYMDKQNQVKGSRQKKDPNDPVAALEIAQKTVTKIGAIDTTAWTDEERESFRATIVELRDKIDSFLSPSSAPA
jgi:ParB family chromosome partitioning protein